MYVSDKIICNGDGTLTITIIDSNFTDAVVVPSSGRGGEFWGALIQVYEKRNLNVAANLVAALKKAHAFDRWQRYVGEAYVRKYGQEIEKFMVLM